MWSRKPEWLRKTSAVRKVLRKKKYVLRIILVRLYISGAWYAGYLVAWNRCHKTVNYGLLENVILINWKSHTCTWNEFCATVVARNWTEQFPTTLVSLRTLPCFVLKIVTLCFVRNIGTYLRIYASSLSRRATSASSPPWEHSVSPVCWSTRKCLYEIITWNHFRATASHCVWSTLKVRIFYLYVYHVPIPVAARSKA
jgi:hypothetical protein